MKNILYINACVREESRTARLAERVLACLDGNVTEVKPELAAEPIRKEDDIISRNEDSGKRDFADGRYELARQFAEADVIVVAAPYWDLSFPAILKAYIEQINVAGLTFEYTEEGIPRSLCKTTQMIYVTTAGGPVISDEYGYGYLKTLAKAFYGIEDMSQVKAENLDVIGADVDAILDVAFCEWEKIQTEDNGEKELGLTRRCLELLDQYGFGADVIDDRG